MALAIVVPFFGTAFHVTKGQQSPCGNLNPYSKGM